MFGILVFLHSVFRWLVLASLLWAIFKSFDGYYLKKRFTKSDDALRHWTATIAHVQLLLGIILYTQSEHVKAFFRTSAGGGKLTEPLFFGLIHITIMLTAIICITIGSAWAKRKETDREKFRIILLFFTITLLLILVAIPWPFSPLAQRPLLRTF